MKPESHLQIKRLTISKAAIIVIMLCSIWFQFSVKKWRWDAIIVWDVVSYYAYLPATFIYNDLSLEFTEENPDYYSNKFWPSKSPTNKNVIKTSMGMAILYSPFFTAAHLVASPLGYPADGFSRPYQFFISIGALFYLLFGLIFLRKLLLGFFDEKTTAITLVLITLGTNLWYYATMEPGMSHTYSFALFALFLYQLNRWLEKPTASSTIFLGLLCGIIALVRPTNALVGVFFVLWKVSSFEDLKNRGMLLLLRWKNLLALALLAFIVWIPQLVYWKIQTGQLLYNSYGEERFFFLSPNIIEGLFSFRKGWFIYTPMMITVVVGFFFLKRYAKGTLVSILTFTLINIFVIFSWWSWWYGGGYGARAVIESYAFLAIPLAALIQLAREQGSKIRILVFSGLIFLLAHSVFQTFQYYYGAIHWDSMTKESYFKSFGRLKPFPGLEDYWRAPDYEKALKGINAYAPLAPKVPEKPRELVKMHGCDMEIISTCGTFFVSSNGEVLFEGAPLQSKEKSKSGGFSVLVESNNPFALAHYFDVKPGGSLTIEIWRHAKSPSEAVLVASASDPNIFYQASGVTAERDGEWNLLKLNLVIPENFPESNIKVYVWNPSNKKAFFDDLMVCGIEN